MMADDGDDGENDIGVDLDDDGEDGEESPVVTSRVLRRTAYLIAAMGALHATLILIAMFLVLDNPTGDVTDAQSSSSDNAAIMTVLLAVIGLKVLGDGIAGLS
jgi:hypothetical protein